MTTTIFEHATADAESIINIASIPVGERCTLQFEGSLGGGNLVLWGRLDEWLAWARVPVSETADAPLTDAHLTPNDSGVPELIRNLYLNVYELRAVISGAGAGCDFSLAIKYD